MCRSFLMVGSKENHLRTEKNNQHSGISLSAFAITQKMRGRSIYGTTSHFPYVPVLQYETTYLIISAAKAEASS